MTEKAVELLREWFDYWRASDAMPAKMPNSLHTRTATFLTVYDLDAERHD